MSTTSEAITTLQFYPKRSALRRYFALWYFTILLIVWNILGHTFLGFEQSHIQPLVGLATAISLQFLLEWIDARSSDRKPRYAGSWADFVNFLPGARGDADAPRLPHHRTAGAASLPRRLRSRGTAGDRARDRAQAAGRF